MFLCIGVMLAIGAVIPKLWF